jgi:hypothetical protein
MMAAAAAWNKHECRRQPSRDIRADGRTVAGRFFGVASCYAFNGAEAGICAGHTYFAGLAVNGGSAASASSALGAGLSGGAPARTAETAGSAGLGGAPALAGIGVVAPDARW